MKPKVSKEMSQEIREEKVIELSKVKIVLLICSAVVFVLLGAWFLSMDAQREYWITQVAYQLE